MSEMNSGQNLKVGIIGQGYWGPKLTRNFIDLLGVNNVVVADSKDDRLLDITNHYLGIITFNNGNNLIESDVDAVVIATPVHTHYALAKRALLAGKHVMIEKPITNQSQQAEKLISMAKENKLTLMVGHTYVYNPAVNALHYLLKSGELGKIYYIDSMRVNLGLLQPDINVMWDLAPHDLSILCYILGENPQKVSAVGENFINKTSRKAEVVFINLRFPSGILANIHLSWLDPVKQRRMTIVGSKKMIVYDDIVDDKIVIYDKGVEIPDYSLTMNEFSASYRHGGEQVYNYKWEEPLKSECKQFIDSIKLNIEPPTNGDNGLTIVRILEAAQRSLENGGVELLVEY